MRAMKHCNGGMISDLAERMVREASRQPMLERDEERRLALQVGAGDTEAARRMIVSHLRFVIKIARAYRTSGLPMSDLVQEGTIGLMHAVRRFNPDHGVRLSTYAMWWIRAAIQEHVIRSWSLVKIGTTNAQRSLFLRLRKMTSEFMDGAEGMSDDLVGKLSKRFGATAAEVSALAQRVARRDLSLDMAADQSGETWISRLICDAPTPEQTIAEAGERHFLGDMVARALAMLPPREALIIRRRYFEEARHTFEAIGRELGLSKDRVRQLEARALERLRDLLHPAIAESL